MFFLTLELENHIQGVIHLQLSSMKFILKIKFGPERVHWINTNAAALAFLKSITFPPHYTVFKSNEIYWYRLYNKQFIKILHKLLISTPPQKKNQKTLCTVIESEGGHESTSSFYLQCMKHEKSTNINKLYKGWCKDQC